MLQLNYKMSRKFLWCFLAVIALAKADLASSESESIAQSGNGGNEEVEGYQQALPVRKIFSSC